MFFQCQLAVVGAMGWGIVLAIASGVACRADCRDYKYVRCSRDMEKQQIWKDETDYVGEGKVNLLRV